MIGIALFIAFLIAVFAFYVRCEGFNRTKGESR